MPELNSLTLEQLNELSLAQLNGLLLHNYLDGAIQTAFSPAAATSGSPLNMSLPLLVMGQ